MRTKKGFKLRDICGEKIIVAEGLENIDFCNIISMNESSAYLWKQVEGKEFTVEQLAELLTNEYEVDKETAKRDCKALTEQWLKAQIIEAE